MHNPPHPPLRRLVLRSAWTVQKRSSGSYQHQARILLARRRRRSVLLHKVVQRELDSVQGADEIEGDGRQGRLFG